MWDISDILLARTTPFTFNALHCLLRACGLEDDLEDYADFFTLFAPPDEAFSALKEKSPFDLMKDIDKLRLLLNFHIVPLKLSVDDLQDLFMQSHGEPELKLMADQGERPRSVTLETLSGFPLHVTLDADIRVADAHILHADILTANGVVHVIDKLIWPPGLSEACFHGNVPFSKAEET
ncbi:fasciclin domain-containing protein [Dictyobacter vulcani]|nr:fasciclin domain-containing protein [Dictyobacter vulcani]